MVIVSIQQFWTWLILYWVVSMIGNALFTYAGVKVLKKQFQKSPPEVKLMVSVAKSTALTPKTKKKLKKPKLIIRFVYSLILYSGFIFPILIISLIESTIWKPFAKKKKPADAPSDKKPKPHGVPFPDLDENDFFKEDPIEPINVDTTKNESSVLFANGDTLGDEPKYSFTEKKVHIYVENKNPHQEHINFFNAEQIFDNGYKLPENVLITVVEEEPGVVNTIDYKLWLNSLAEVPVDLKIKDIRVLHESAPFLEYFGPKLVPGDPELRSIRIELGLNKNHSIGGSQHDFENNLGDQEINIFRDMYFHTLLGPTQVMLMEFVLTTK